MARWLEKKRPGGLDLGTADVVQYYLKSRKIQDNTGVSQNDSTGL